MATEREREARERVEREFVERGGRLFPKPEPVELKAKDGRTVKGEFLGEWPDGSRLLVTHGTLTVPRLIRLLARQAVVRLARVASRLVRRRGSEP